MLWSANGKSLAEFGLMRVRYVLEDGELAKSHYRKQISFCTCFISQPERGGGGGG
jgi:hypothetical protein